MNASSFSCSSRLAMAASLISLILALYSSLPRPIPMTAFIFSSANVLTSDSTVSSALAGINSRFSLPNSLRNSSWKSHNLAIEAWATLMASSISISEISSISPSIIKTESRVPPTTISISDSFNSVTVGLIIYSPLILPTRTSPIGPSKGTSDKCSAKLAPTAPNTSPSFSSSEEITELITCVSL